MKDLTSGNIYKTFVFFAIPMVLSGILSQAYSLIDSIIAGKYLGTLGLAATGATSSLIAVVESMIWGYEMGFSIYIARLFGAKEYAKIKNAIYNITVLLFFITTIIGVAMILIHEYICEWLNIDVSIRSANFQYFAIIMGGLFPIMFNININFLMNSFGISNFPFYMSVVSGLLNVAGNIFTITVLDMGVAGVALATIVSSLVVMVCYILKLRSCFREMGVEKEKVKWGFQTIKDSLGYALPTTVQQMVVYIAGVIIAPFINGIGTMATVAYSVVSRVHAFTSNVAINAAKTLSNFASQCIGAKKYKMIKKGVRVGFIQSFLFMIPFLILSVIFAEELCGAFFRKGYTGEDFSSAVLFTRVYFPFIVFCAIGTVFHAFFRGVKAMNYLLVSYVFGAIVRIAATIYFVNIYAMEGVYIGWVISWILEAVYLVLIYFKGKWKPEQM